jgi:hypothetical protein
MIIVAAIMRRAILRVDAVQKATSARRRPLKGVRS